MPHVEKRDRHRPVTLEGVMRTIDAPEDLLEVSAAVEEAASRIARVLSHRAPETDPSILRRLAADELWLAAVDVAQVAASR